MPSQVLHFNGFGIILGSPVVPFRTFLFCGSPMESQIVRTKDTLVIKGLLGNLDIVYIVGTGNLGVFNLQVLGSSFAETIF